MNMNYCQIPYEADYNDDGGANKIMGLPQMNMQAGAGGAQPTAMPISMPLNMPNMNVNQMQLPMGGMAPMSLPLATTGQMSYPLQRNMVQSQSQPLAMMQQPMQSMQPMQPMQQVQGNQMTMSQLSLPTMSQLPPGAVTPLNSMTVMPMMGGGIDGGGMNVVVPDLQPMSAMHQMSPNGQMPQMQQQQQGRLSGSSTNTANWMNCGGGGGGATCVQMMPGNNMWSYTQGYPNMQLQQQQQHQQQQQSQQQQQQQQQQQRMKSHYVYSGQQNGYREARNGLNSPSMNDSFRFARGSSGSISAKKVPHWR